MKNRDSKEWIWPPADQWITVWGMLVIAVVGILGSPLLLFFSGLTGTQWIWCYGIGLAVAPLGVSLIFYAKLPLYRQRRFFTFGSGTLPERRRSFYRWGYRCVAFAAALLLCLLLSSTLRRGLNIAGAKAAWRRQFAAKSRALMSPRPGVSQLHCWPA